MQNLTLKSVRYLAIFVWCLGFLGIAGLAGAQEPDYDRLGQELAQSGFTVLDSGIVHGVPYVEIQVPRGDSVVSIIRRVPSLNAAFFRYRTKIAFLNGVNPFYIKSIYGEPFSLEADALKIPLDPGLDPEIFPAFEDSLAAHKKFILIDLDKGYMALYARGELERVFPISGGKTAKQTPLLTFKIKAKDKEHWSSIYDVWMPYSLLMESPYYIHGGVLPGEHDSAGCIRMFRQDAQELYHLVDVGTPGRVVQASRIKEPIPDQPLAKLSANQGP